MNIKVTDRWRNDHQRATDDDVFAFFDRFPPKRRAEAEACVTRLFSLCANAGLDFALALARIGDETGDLNGPAIFVSDIWASRLNPGGIGVTDGGDEMISFPNGTAAANAYFAHLATYVLQPTYNILGVTKADDPRFDATPAAWRGSVETLDDLRGKWFSNPQGAIDSAARGNRIFPGIADQIGDDVPTTPPPTGTLNMSPGLIPMPTLTEDIIDVSQRDQSIACRGYDNLGPRRFPPKFLVLHRSINGANQSNSGFFHEPCCPALTDLEVIAATGQGRRFARIPGDVSGWANGVVSAPYGDALAWLNQHGWDLSTVNRDGESCEITGRENDPVSAAAWQWLAQWIASRAHDYGITYEAFPLIPREQNRSYVTWHEEWTIGTGKRCPFGVVKAFTPTLIEMARAIMKAAQTATKPTKPPTYAEPVVPEWLTADLERGYPGDHDLNGVKVYGALRPYTALKATKRLQTPDPGAKVVGPNLKVKETFKGFYHLVATDAKGVRRGYVMTQYGTLIASSALDPKLSVKAA